MGKQTRTVLKGYFQTGDIPTESQYIDLIDSNLNLSENNTGNIQLTGNITASSNISSSATVIGNSGSFGSVAGTLSTAAQPNVTSLGTLTSVTTGDVTATGNSVLGNAVTDTHTLTGNITSSGNISSSGNFIGNNIELTGNSLTMTNAVTPTITLTDTTNDFSANIKIDSIQFGIECESNSNANVYITTHKYNGDGGGEYGSNSFDNTAMFMDAGTGMLSFNDASVQISNNGHITASGAISSSFTSTGSLGMLKVQSQLFVHEGEFDIGTGNKYTFRPSSGTGTFDLSVGTTEGTINYNGSKGIKIKSDAAHTFLQDNTIQLGNGTGTEIVSVSGSLIVGKNITGSNMSISGDIVHTGDTDTKIEFTTDQIDFTCGGEQMLRLDEGAQDKVEFNTGLNDIDFQVNSNGKSNIIKVLGENGYVGIDKSTPEFRLDVQANNGIRFSSLTTSDPGVAGQLYNDGGTLKISAG